MSSTVTKRLACERCRDQKLRCDRAELPNGEFSKACARCLRAGASCVSSNPRPLGRPPASASRSSTHGVAGRRSRRTINVGHGTGHAEAAASPGSIFTWDLRDPTPNGPDHDQAWAPAASDAFSFLGLPLGDNDALLESLSGAQPAPNLGDCWPGVGESVYSVTTATDGAGSVPSNGPGTFSDTIISHNDRNDQAPQRKPPLNPLLGLSRLTESITHQIEKVDSYPWGPAGTSICTENVHGSLDNNPVAKALQSTSDFISIVQQMSSSHPSASVFQPTGAFAPSDSGVSASGGADGQNASASSDSPPPTNPAAVDAPVTLLVLSNYLLLLQLYDQLIHRVLEALRKLLNPSDFFQTGPDICMGGLPPMKGHLYIKIVVQFINDHIDRLEQLLGLPENFRVSKRKGPSVGMLSGVESSGLLQMVMGQLSVGPEGAGTELVESLRSKLKSLHGILEGS